MATAVKAEAEKTLFLPHPAPVRSSVYSSRYPLVLYSHPPFAPFLWPPIGQSSYHVHLHRTAHDSQIIESNISAPASHLSDSCERSHCINDSGGQLPFYALPFPWFLPLPDYGNAAQTSNSGGVKEETSSGIVNDQFSPSSSSSRVRCGDDRSTTLPREGRKEASGTAEVRHVQETGAGAGAGAERRELSSSCLGRASSVRRGKDMFAQRHIGREAASEISRNACALPGKKQEQVALSCRSPSGAVAAAEARKRRKELTKLKNIHGRQCRMG